MKRLCFNIFENMAAMGLNDANGIVAAALSAAADIKCNPLAVVVVDGAGNTVASVRQDGSPPLRIKMAENKAWSVIAAGRTTRSLAELQNDRPLVFQALNQTAGERLVPLAGGIPAVDQNGQVCGAVGVAGDTPDRDEACAVIGLQAVGLHPKRP